MLTWNDIRAVDSIADPLGVLSVYADRPDRDTGGRLLRAVALAGELRRVDADMRLGAGDEAAAAFRRAVERLRPALVRALEPGGRGGRALFVPLSTDEVIELAVALPVGVTVALEPTAYVRPLAERVVDAALCDQTAVLGAVGTLEALAERRVDHLLLDAERDYRWSGALAGLGGEWPRRDLAEHLIELALHGGADITPLEGGARSLLTEAGGVAAMLR